MQKFIKNFYLSCISFIETFILVFPFHGNVVLLFRENFVCLLYLFLSLKTLRTSLLSLLFMIEIPTFALLFQNFETYFIPTFLTEGTWKPAVLISLYICFVQPVQKPCSACTDCLISLTDALINLCSCICWCEPLLLHIKHPYYKCVSSVT